MTKAKLQALISAAVVVIAVVVWTGRSRAQQPSSSQTPLRGTVKSSDGKPLEGVAVRARPDGKNFSMSVYTGRSGGYFFPLLVAPLEDGQYQVWAQAVGFEAGRSMVELSAGKAVEQNFALQPLQDFSSQLSGVEWTASLPEATPQDRRGKRLLATNCNTCHSLGIALQNRFDAIGWTLIVNAMEKATPSGLDHNNNRVHGYIHQYKEEIVEYLTRVRGPGSAPLAYKPLPRASGEATQIVVTEYDISPGHLPGYVMFDNGSDWSQGSPSHYESRGVHDAVLDQQGYVWFSDQATPKRTIGKLDPRTGQVTDYTLLGKDNMPVATHDIAVDQMGNVWTASMGRPSMFVRFDPRTEKFQWFPPRDSIPITNLANLMAVDSKGNVWEGNGGRGIPNSDSGSGIQYRTPKADPQQPGGAIKLDPKTGEYTYYKPVTPATQYYGVVIDAEDNAWFTQPGHDRIGVVDGRTGKVGEVIVPPIDDGKVQYTAQDQEIASNFEAGSQVGPPWQMTPRRGAADLHGNTVWHSGSKGSRLLKTDIHTKKVTVYPMPYPYSYPYGLGVDKNHMVWISSNSADKLFKFNPFTEKFTAYPLPSLGVDSRFISVDNRTDPPTIWMAYWGTSKVARVQFRTPAVRQTASR